MTRNERTADQLATPRDPGTSQDLAEQYWTTMARTADLVRKLTALADRYDAALRDGGPQAADSRRRVALMRATAEAGRQLIRAQAPPAVPLAGQPAPSAPGWADDACSRDVRASGRDACAQVRDERAAQRDIRVRAVTNDGDLDVSGRFLAACDRDAAAGDRADALADRQAAQRDRDTSMPRIGSRSETSALVARLEERAVVRQAQGILMARAGITAGEAFEVLLLAATGSLTLDDVADQVVRGVDLPDLPVGT